MEASATITEPRKRQAKKKAPKKRKYSKAGLLLKRVQEQNRKIITVVVYDLLDANLAAILQKKEKEYRENP